MSKIRFVLVHGFWHYGQLWKTVAAKLRWAGHEAHAPTIKGFNVGDAPDKVTYAAQVASIADYITGKNLDGIVLVGHSYGGAIIQGVAQAIPERVHRLVFQNALVIRDGVSVLEEVPPNMADVWGQPGETNVLPPPPYELWRDVMIGDAEDTLAKSSYATLRPAPLAPVAEKLDLAGFYELIKSGRFRCSYLNATEDITMPPGEWAWHPRFSSRLGLYRLVQMPGSHEVMFSKPGELARKLIEAGRD